MKFERLENIVDIRKGKKTTLTSLSGINSTRVLQIEDLRNDDNLKFTADNTGVLATEDDILIAWDGANAGTVGFGKSGYVGSTIARLRIKEGQEISTFFLGTFLRSKFYYLQQKTTGASIPHIDPKSLKGLKVPVFAFSDQVRIASLLSKADTLVKKRAESIKHLDVFLSSTFLDMFYSNPKTRAWKEVTLQELSSNKNGGMRSGPFGSSLLHKEFTEKGEVRVLGIDNVSTNSFAWKKMRGISLEKFQELKRYQVFPGDVLVSIMATLGRTAVAPDDLPLSINSKHLVAITLNQAKANPHFIAFALHSDPLILGQLKTRKKGAIMDGLNLSIIKKIKLKLPPHPLQNLFAEIVEKVESLKKQYLQSLLELENLFGSLSQLAFSGKLDLSKVKDLSETTPSSRAIEPSSQILKKPEEQKAKAAKQVKSQAPKSNWQTLKTFGKATRIPFTQLEGETVLAKVFSKKSKAFSFQEFEAFLTKEGFAHDFAEVKKFICQKLESKELRQYYASEGWMKNNFNPEVLPEHDEFTGDEGTIWLVPNNNKA